MQTESAARPLEPAATSGLGHRPELDGLRGISILLILYYHFKLSQQLPGGFLGVDIFFVLSGFLITSLLVEEWAATGRISLRQFYARRALRLLPALGVLLGAMCAMAALFLSRQPAVDVYIASLLTLFYVTNWAAALQLVHSLGPLGITWSLAIEEQFYLLWPPLLAVMLRLGWTRRRILLVLTGLLLLVVGYRALLWARGVNFGRLYYSSHTRADSLLVGCIAGLLVAWDLVGRGARSAWWLKTLALVAVLVLVVLVNVIDSPAPFLYCGGFTLAALSVAVLLLALTLAPPKLLLVPLRFAPLTWVGRISYALYLWHWPVHWYQYRLPGTRGRQALLGVALSFVLAALSYYLVERPFLRLKRRFTPPRGAGQGSGAADRGQKIGTSSMMMTKTATVSMPPTLTKSKKR